MSLAVDTAALSSAAPIGLGWALVIASPLAVAARRSPARVHARSLAGAERAATRSGALARWARDAPRAGRAVPGATVVRVVVRVTKGVTGRRRAARRRTLVAAALPATLDLLGVAASAGCTPYGTLDVASAWAHDDVGRPMREALRSCELGAGFAEALHGLSAREPALRGIAEALELAASTGAPLGPHLERLASESRAAARRAAEIRARALPTKLLFPLVCCILPAFGLLTVVPTLLGGLARL